MHVGEWNVLESWGLMEKLRIILVLVWPKVGCYGMWGLCAFYPTLYVFEGESTYDVCTTRRGAGGHLKADTEREDA